MNLNRFVRRPAIQLGAGHLHDAALGGILLGSPMVLLGNVRAVGLNFRHYSVDLASKAIDRALECKQPRNHLADLLLN